jgi:hypothetical protein
MSLAKSGLPCFGLTSIEKGEKPEVITRISEQSS